MCAREKVPNAMLLSEVFKPLKEHNKKSLPGLYLLSAIYKPERLIADGEANTGKGTDQTIQVCVSFTGTG